MKPLFCLLLLLFSCKSTNHKLDVEGPKASVFEPTSGSQDLSGLEAVYLVGPVDEQAQPLALTADEPSLAVDLAPVAGAVILALAATALHHRLTKPRPHRVEPPSAPQKPAAAIVPPPRVVVHPEADIPLAIVPETTRTLIGGKLPATQATIMRGNSRVPVYIVPDEKLFFSLLREHGIAQSMLPTKPGHQIIIELPKQSSTALLTDSPPPHQGSVPDQTSLVPSPAVGESRGLLNAIVQTPGFHFEANGGTVTVTKLFPPSPVKITKGWLWNTIDGTTLPEGFCHLIKNDPTPSQQFRLEDLDAQAGIHNMVGPGDVVVIPLDESPVSIETDETSLKKLFPMGNLILTAGKWYEHSVQFTGANGAQLSLHRVPNLIRGSDQFAAYVVKLVR